MCPHHDNHHDNGILEYLKLMRSYRRCPRFILALACKYLQAAASPEPYLGIIEHQIV